MDEKKNPGTAEQRSFEEISRLARERDYRELEARRTRLADAEERARDALADYRSRLRRIEENTNLKIEDIALLQNTARRYCINTSAYRSLAALRDPNHQFYAVAQEIKNGPGSEAEKLRISQEHLFQAAQKENPYLEKFTVDDVLRVAQVFIPRRPNQTKAAAERAQYLQVEYLNMLRIPFSQSRDTLDDTFYDMSERIRKDQLPDHSERAKALLSEFLQQVEHCLDLQRGSSIDRDSLSGLQELTKTEGPKGLNPSDKMLDLYLEYLTELHQAGDDPAGLQPTKAEQKVLRAIQTFSSGATMLVDQISGMLDGELTVPPEDAAEENGKTIHRIDARGQQPKLTKDYYSKKKADANALAAFEPAGDLVPLFGEDSPSPEDIHQGKLGDCYLLAGLTTLAAQDPKKIRDAMKDNLDGTVTVRFFSSAGEPVYVTVDKSVPKQDGEDIYAKSSLWVQIMERAYVQSGLHSGAMEKAEADSEARKALRQAEQELADAQEAAQNAAAEELAEPDDLQKVLRSKEKQDALRKAERTRQEKAKAAKAAAWQGEYDSIEGGHMPDFICRMLGTQGIFKSGYSFQMHFFSGNKGPYTDREQRFIQELQESLAEGEYVTTATPLFRLPLIGLQEVSGIDLERAGLPTQHAYAITGVEQEGDKYYILVRNPHGKKGVNSNEDGELRMMDDTYADGYSRLELRDFSRLFSFVFTNHYDMTRARAETLAEAKTITRAYGESVRKITETLESSDSALLYFRNSSQFTKFKKEAAALNRLMQSPAPTPEKLYRRLDAFFAAAEAYSGYCENEKKLNLFKDNRRSFVRYQAAKIAAELKSVVLANRGRTLNERWDEFSYTAAKEKVRVPTSAADALEVCRSTADSVADRLTRKSGNFSDLETRIKFYRYLRGFAAEKTGKKLAEKADPGLNDSQRFDFIQKNAQDVSIQYLLKGYADELVEAMRRDGYLDRHPDLAPRLIARENDRIPFADTAARTAQTAAAAPKDRLSQPQKT